MTKEKTARLIPNAIQVCTDTEKVKDTETLGRNLHEVVINAVMSKSEQCFGLNLIIFT